jgi:hypothetical protein
MRQTGYLAKSKNGSKVNEAIPLIFEIFGVWLISPPPLPHTTHLTVLDFFFL